MKESDLIRHQIEKAEDTHTPKQMKRLHADLKDAEAREAAAAVTSDDHPDLPRVLAQLAGLKEQATTLGETDERLPKVLDAIATTEEYAKTLGWKVPA